MSSIFWDEYSFESVWLDIVLFLYILTLCMLLHSQAFLPVIS